MERSRAAGLAAWDPVAIEGEIALGKQAEGGESSLEKRGRTGACGKAAASQAGSKSNRLSHFSGYRAVW